MFLRCCSGISRRWVGWLVGRGGVGGRMDELIDCLASCLRALIRMNAIQPQEVMKHQPKHLMIAGHSLGGTQVRLFVCMCDACVCACVNGR